MLRNWLFRYMTFGVVAVPPAQERVLTEIFASPLLPLS